MNLQELQSLKSRGRDKLIFVMNNGGYASIRATQRNYFNGRLVATDPDSGLEIPEINKIAVCFGFDYCKNQILWICPKHFLRLLQIRPSDLRGSVKMMRD